MTPNGAGLIYLVLIALAGAFFWRGLDERDSQLIRWGCFGAAALAVSLMVLALMARTIAEGP